MKYVYPAIIYAAQEGGYYVEFPDVKGCLTQGATLYEVLDRAEGALALMLVDMPAPPPSPISKIKPVPDEYSTEAFVTLIKTDTDAYRQKL